MSGNFTQMQKNLRKRTGEEEFRFKDQKTIIAADSGNDVPLSCRAPNNNNTGVKWSRTDLESEYMLLYYDGQFVPAQQHPSFKNRVELKDRQMKDGDVSVILKGLTTADTGMYECLVFMRETRSWKPSLTYLVVLPEKKPITADPGQSVTLPCRAPNNNAAVKWSRADLEPDYVLLYQDGQFVSDKQHPSFKNRVDLQDRQMKDGDASLILKNVTTADSGTYRCRVFMAETRSWKLFSIIYQTVVLPGQKTVTANLGQSTTLTCRDPNNNNMGVKWSRADLKTEYVLLYQDGNFVPDNQHSSFRNRVDLQDRQMKDGNTSLILKNVNSDDEGTYECRVLAAVTRSWQLISIIYLRVALPEHNQITTADSGQSSRLPCHNPFNSRGVKWTKAELEPENVLLYQGGQFDPNNQNPSFKNRVELQDSQMNDGDVTLVLKDVNTDDVGDYECRVPRTYSINYEWEFIRIFHLIVPPVQETIKAKSGQSVTLPCRAPNSNTAVKWNKAELETERVLLYQDGHFVPDNQHPSFKNRVDLKDRQMKDGDVSLILKNTMTDDEGTYECRVFMRFTSSWKLSSIIYLRVVPPDKKTVTAESGQNTTLPCRAPNKNTGVKWSRADLETEYVLFYHDGNFDPANQHPSFKNRVDLQDRQMKDGDASLIITNVTTNTTAAYECRVFMEETRSWNLSSIINLKVVDPPGQPGAPVGLAVGLSILAVVLVAGVGFLIYRKYKKNKYTGSAVPTAHL